MMTLMFISISNLLQVKELEMLKTSKHIKAFTEMVRLKKGLGITVVLGDKSLVDMKVLIQVQASMQTVITFQVHTKDPTIRGSIQVRTNLEQEIQEYKAVKRPSQSLQQQSGTIINELLIFRKKIVETIFNIKHIIF
jgi:hypothetical protein